MEQGLTPVEIGVVVVASVLAASSCPCILFVLVTRRRQRTKKGKVLPEGGDEDPPSEISDLSEIDADMNIAINQTYSTHGQNRIQLLPREAWAKAKQLTIPVPKNVPEGAWF